MYCVKCNKNLDQCDCPDLEERFKAITQHVCFGLDYLELIITNIKARKLERKRGEKEVAE